MVENHQKPSKISVLAMRLVLIGNMPIAKEILDMLELGHKPSQV